MKMEYESVGVCSVTKLGCLIGGPAKRKIKDYIDEFGVPKAAQKEEVEDLVFLAFHPNGIGYRLNYSYNKYITQKEGKKKHLMVKFSNFIGLEHGIYPIYVVVENETLYLAIVKKTVRWESLKKRSCLPEIEAVFILDERFDFIANAFYSFFGIDVLRKDDQKEEEGER